MRIALVDPLAYTPPYDHSLASALGARGHDVVLLTGPFLHGDVPEPDEYEREEVFLPLSARLFAGSPRSRLRLPVKAVEYAPSWRRLQRRIKDADVVHVQWLPRPELDLRRLQRVASTRPLVLTAHDVVPRRPRARAIWPEVLSIPERVVVHSTRAVDEVAALGVPRDHVVRIAHPVFEAEELPPPTGRTLLFFGLIREYKGLDLLVRAMAQMPDVRLVVAGDPVDPIAAVRELAQQQGVDERIEWLLHFIPDEEVKELMTRAAAVVLPYRELDSSGVLATAIGYRRAVVVTDVGSLGEIVREFDAGEVVSPDDVDALTAACLRLLEPARLAEATAGAGRAAEELTWAKAAAAHERVYQEIR
jgi:glycosyltransferase involved in cell wall biosynthesis